MNIFASARPIPSASYCSRRRSITGSLAPSPPTPPSSSKASRRALLSAVLFSPIISSANNSRALEATILKVDDDGGDEQRLVRLFQETTLSVVCIKDEQLVDDQENVKLDGIGSGFIWDNIGHIVTNYHVVSKFATDKTGRQRCKVFILDSSGKTLSKEGKLIGVDPSHDLAVLKVDVGGDLLQPAVLGTSNDLRVGQSCFAIGNPYGYEHTLTTGVVSGLGREIPSPNGQSIRGAIQTDASINAGNSGGPLIDSHGHVIGVNTSTFSRKGTGLSSGVNFAIPVDLVVRTVPYLIVYGTSTSNRF